MNVKFYELAVGARFSFRDRHFVKTALSMAEDERHWGNVFMEGTPVISDGPLLPPDLAAAAKPDYGHWAAVIEGLAEGLLSQDSCLPPNRPSP